MHKKKIKIDDVFVCFNRVKLVPKEDQGEQDPKGSL